jgi:hypothetical protein
MDSNSNIPREAAVCNAALQSGITGGFFPPDAMCGSGDPHDSRFGNRRYKWDWRHENGTGDTGKMT